MLIIKATRLGYLVAFFSPNTMRLYDETDVINNVLLGDSCGWHIMIMRKKKTHLLHVVADGTG